MTLPGTQQNAVGFTGYDTIAGPERRTNRGYGQNINNIVRQPHMTSLEMTGSGGSMQLSVFEEEVSYTAAWENLASLHSDFYSDGKLSGKSRSSSPKTGETVDGALAAGFTLRPNEEKVVTFVLSWHFPGGTFGRSQSSFYNAYRFPTEENRIWYFPEAGSHYENWWSNAADVGSYVYENFDYLDSTTRLYYETLFSSTIPRYLPGRISSNICVLKSPTTFWTKDGYFGIWESTSSLQEWFGNVKHVIHYAQGHARLFPELGRILRNIDLDSQTSRGLLPARDGQILNAMDGHFGTILGVYREHLLSDNNDFLTAAWPRTQRAMDYAISEYDSDQDGMLSGGYHNTLDTNVSGTSPWVGTLYLAALKACEKMATITGDPESAAKYNRIWTLGKENQNKQLWNDSLGYYIEQTENLPNTRVMGQAVSIDMLLGQWWANQLDLGQIYPIDRTIAGLEKIFSTNRITDPGEGYYPSFRDFLGTGDTGWMMAVFPDKVPDNRIRYYNEVMSGFEYAAATAMLQYGMLDEGLAMIRAISERYDGRLRAEGEVHMANSSTVNGTGSPFGEDECGKFYVRPLSSWSALLALQGFIYNGPEQTIGFNPVWKPDNHASFFTTSAAWGLYSQIQTDASQVSEIDVKFGTARIKEITLGVPDQAIAKNISVKLGDREQNIEFSEQVGNTITIRLESTCEIDTESTLTVYLAFNN